MIIDTRSVCRVLRIGLAVLVVAFITPLPALAACAPNTINGQAVAIANGHAFVKHGAEFVHGRVIHELAFPNATITNRQGFATFIEDIMTNPNLSKALNNRRTAYWQTATGTVVVRNLGANDCGTAFRPDAGQQYFDNLN